jgi:ankyrin repeat protein
MTRLTFAYSNTSMTFRINLGSCTACNTRSAVLGASRTCGSCLVDLDRLCLSCADCACPKCGGKLAQKNEVFPYTLFDALELGNLDKVRELHYANGQDINTLRNSSGRSPLSFAASSSRIPNKHRVAAVECLLLLGASPTAVDHGDRTPLIHASMNRNLTQSLAALLLSSINCQDGMGKTALMYAAQGHNAVNIKTGNHTVARLLLENGADALIQCQRKLTALGYAIHANSNGTNEKIVRYLKQEMLRQAAERVFKNEYEASFGADGSFQVFHKNGAAAALN